MEGSPKGAIIITKFEFYQVLNDTIFTFKKNSLQCTADSTRGAARVCVSSQRGTCGVQQGQTGTLGHGQLPDHRH